MLDYNSISGIAKKIHIIKKIAKIISDDFYRPPPWNLGQ
jgi:hypothetical protein